MMLFVECCVIWLGIFLSLVKIYMYLSISHNFLCNNLYIHHNVHIQQKNSVMKNRNRWTRLKSFLLSSPVGAFSLLLPRLSSVVPPSYLPSDDARIVHGFPLLNLKSKDKQQLSDVISYTLPRNSVQTGGGWVGQHQHASKYVDHGVVAAINLIN